MKLINTTNKQYNQFDLGTRGKPTIWSSFYFISGNKIEMCYELKKTIGILLLNTSFGFMVKKSTLDKIHDIKQITEK